jgi:hypothetical protein
MKNAVFWDLEPCGSCKSQRFGGTCRLQLKDRKNPRAKKCVSSWLTLLADYFYPEDGGDTFI